MVCRRLRRWNESDCEPGCSYSLVVSPMPCAEGVPYRQPLDYGTHKIIAALARRRRHAPASPLLQLGFLIVARLQT